MRVGPATTTTASLTFNIHNAGDMPLTIDDVALTGPNAGDFTIDTEPAAGTSVLPNGNASVKVTFNPSAPGTRDATLQVFSNDADSPTGSLLTGTGTNAVIAVTNVAFGTIGEGTTDTQSISVSNTGAAPRGTLHVTNASITGGDGWFTFATNGAADCENDPTCALNLDVTGTPQSVGVRCSPPANATGTQNATVTFTSDSDAGGDAVADLSCTAGRANIDVQTAALAFNDVRVDAAPVAQNIIVGNNGNLPLVFNATKVVSTFSGMYALSGCVTACNVPPGATRTVTVTFDPTAPTSPNANIDILITPTNDPDTTSVTVPVTGRGTAPQIDPPDEVALGDVDVGQTSAAQELTVTNTGTATLLITNAALTAGASDYTVTNGTTGNQMTSVPPMTSVTWTLTCTPTTHGARPGTFRILSDSFMLNNAEVPLTCNGRRGVLTVAPTSHNFGPTQVGTPKEVTVVLSNTGNVAVTGITATLNPATATFYSIVPANSVPTTLAPGETRNLIVRFDPQTGADGGLATFKFDGVWGTGATPTAATLTLNGDGQSTGFNLSETAIDFGNLRFDTTLTRTFCITNPNETTVTIQSPITIVPGTGTSTGEFAVTAIRRQTTCGMGGSSVTLPQTLTTGQVLEVTVRADPANRTGMMQATLTVTSNLSPNPSRTLTLAGNSTSGAITLDPGALVNFGAVDVQGPPQTRTLKIRNTGDAPLDLSAFTRTTDPQFTFTLPPNTTVPVGGSLDIVITYTPIVAAPMGSEEEISLSHTIAGVLGAPASQTIVIRGRGIDRFIDLAPTPTFPDTYRNPGTDAPERTVRVQNLGEATLKLSAVMFTQTANAWELVNPSPVDIPKDGFHEFRIRFKPPMEAAFDAMLRIVHDDDSKPPIQIMLRGNGLDRDVRFTPTTIQLGLTRVGVPLTLPEALIVSNVDTRSTFRIMKIELDEGSPFTVDGFEPGTPLPALGEERYDVTFTPEMQGTFSVKARIYLDMDHESVRSEATIEGTAVFVDAHGGGGCAAGGSGAGGGAAGGAILALAALLGQRRRQRRRSAARAAVAAAASVSALALAPAPAAAEDIVLSVFDPVPATTSNGFQLQSPDVGASGSWAASAVASYATDPLILDGVANGELVNNYAVVSQSTAMNLGLAVAFLGRFEAGARIPLYTQQGQAGSDAIAFPVAPAEGTALGDLALHGKVRLLNQRLEGDGAFIAGVAAQLTVPTATRDQLTGVEKPTGRVLLLGSLMPGAFQRRVTLTMNAGAVLRSPAAYENLEQKSGVAWGLGATVRALDSLWLAGEVYGDTVFGGRTDAMTQSRVLSPIEWLGGLRWKPDARITLGLAAGRGLTSAVGTPAFRGVLSLTLTPGAPDMRPIVPPKPDGDADGDGVRDSGDRCPGESEDKDLYDDSDGCPDPDNDGDGIADAQDKCPIEAEDKDGVDDADGCIDKDNDRDGIPDVADKCPMQPEDADGFLDTDGCPDEDNDRDGIADGADKCPTAPETINGKQDDDGCPDKGDSLVVLSPDRLELLDTIQFTGKQTIAVAKPSHNLLAQVGATLRARSEIARLRITVHVQPTDDDEQDQQLSDKRAAAVRDWLVQWGVPADRLEVRGFGGTKPLVPPDRKGAAQANQRVELIILERK